MGSALSFWLPDHECSGLADSVSAFLGQLMTSAFIETNDPGKP
ncbi:hypothetical protein C7378_3515 [Acidipila rosea]|uniref:Uncharacterized protein n=1 Tax=Acidipila rosea TaxID=768535 RepID=A0A4R1KYR5_9BACT|nr:hypothetical protein C7378_3515 [Acidipila rosea]